MTLPRLPRAPQGGPGRARPRLLAALLAVVTVTFATGCGLRLETEPPAPLVPDEIEQVRQRTTADAVALEVLAGRVATTTTDPAALRLLTQVQAAGSAHLAALGGIYRPTEAPGSTTSAGTTDPSTATDPAAEPAADSAAEPATETDPATEPTADPAARPETGAGPAAEVVVTGADLVALLDETAASARADAAAVPDGPIARVLAAVAVARLLLADALSRTLVLADGAPVVDPFEVPTELPAGIRDRDVVVLVQSEDAVGLTWEVVAARRAGEERDQAAAHAARHRQRAEDWARAAGISATGSDPRRSAYALPPEITAADADPAATTAALAGLEGDLAATYASLVAQTQAGARSPLIDAMLDAGRVQVSLTGVVPLFPGLPEQAPPLTSAG